MAMSRLTQHAQFETLNALIRELPSTLDKLVIVQLAAAEEKSTTSLVAALLLAAALTRQGLLESEALRILPNVTRAFAEMRAGLSEEEAGKSLCHLQMRHFHTNCLPLAGFGYDLRLMHFYGTVPQAYLLLRMP